MPSSWCNFSPKYCVSFYLYSDEATVISGTRLAHQVLKEVRKDVELWISAGNQRPHLTVILVGDNPASHIYVRNKIKAAAAVGMSYECSFSKLSREKNKAGGIPLAS